MISQYFGHYPYDKSSVSNRAPDNIGVYYCGYINSSSNLTVHYVGRATGQYTSIKSRLLDHLRDDNWGDVTHFGYKTCSTASEAENLEAQEIQRLKPKYNTVGKKAVGW